MVINNLKDLKALVQLCRKEGIDAFEIGDIKFNLGAKPKRERKHTPIEFDIPEASVKIPQYNPIVKQVVADVIKTDDLTQEELLFYSATGDTN